MSGRQKVLRMDKKATPSRERVKGSEEKNRKNRFKRGGEGAKNLNKEKEAEVAPAKGCANKGTYPKNRGCTIR